MYVFRAGVWGESKQQKKMSRLCHLAAGRLSRPEMPAHRRTRKEKSSLFVLFFWKNKTRWRFSWQVAKWVLLFFGPSWREGINLKGIITFFFFFFWSRPTRCILISSFSWRVRFSFWLFSFFFFAEQECIVVGGSEFRRQEFPTPRTRTVIWR